ncbi:hypothetical protein L2E82_45169 [Cichorium intybus]|uniref:Uncharacterized protein n=1 Tax=Cichorium intybus TaxID=13427 RepID=A0ACB8ZSH3_CICIN|nr:hypothetical protein L2E82_45169 [Cichorium intybus]
MLGSSVVLLEAAQMRGRIASRTGSLPPESNSLSSSGGGSRTTHKNLCSLLSNPIAISFRIEYYATVAEPSCELQFAPSGLGYCDVAPGFGVEAPYSELINVNSLHSKVKKNVNLTDSLTVEKLPPPEPKKPKTIQVQVA